ncbi:SAF domain-containing protein [Brevibacterium sanguinis]|uniref:SAF domain-containing protein n=2 Tax=Brevibacterium TaxID=1696 RepID=A0A366IJ37_9MICO|nr:MULTISPECIES: SAF domain-containing protein [Brevibacterium]RBP65500.1 SAF domain-containing protein [Brevibacterium sanguinis]RBP72134.1 SAF domain-containing protein [Brevibacterium celere]
MGIVQRIRNLPWPPSPRVRPRRLLAALCLATACAITVWALTPAQGGSPVVVADEDLPPGTELSDDDLVVVDYPAGLVPDKAFASISEATDKRTSAGLSKGSPVTRSAVLDQQALPAGSTDLIMPVRLTDDASAGLLQPGQRIRLFSSLPEGGSEVVVEEVTIAQVMAEEDGLTGGSGRLVSVILSSEDAGRIAEFTGLPISFAILPR